MIKRWMEEKLRGLLRVRRGVFLTGPRQCGKTTLCNMLELSNVRRMTMDNEMSLRTAVTDPEELVRRLDDETVVIDEIQKAPGLLNYIKMNVDRDNARGQYLLTGSANLRFVKAVKDSLAGRLGWTRLRTLALGEMRGIRPVFLERAFCDDWKREYGELGKRDIIALGFAGGFPEAMSLDGANRKIWYEDYLDDLIFKDAKDVTEIRKVKALKDMTIFLLVHSAQLFKMEELCSACEISKQTAEAYLEVLKAMYIFDSVPAWTDSDYKRVGKKAKLVVSDVGLMANVLGWRQEETFMDGSLNGKFVESFVYHELAAQADASGNYKIFYFRDSEKREIDYVVENEKGEILGIEVKGGAVDISDFKQLKWFKDNLAGKRPFHGVVLYTGKEVCRFGDGFYAVPMGAFGEE